MTRAFLPFSRPSISGADIDAVVEVLRSGWLTTGAKCADLEAGFAETVQAQQAVAVTSATAAMHLALHALGIGPGDEVVTPSMTWVSTVNLIVLRGARPVFVDVEADTLMTTAERVEEVLTSRSKLIVPVHFAGAALDLDPLRALAADRGIALIEDAAHAAGAKYKGMPVGNGGTAIFSLHPIKNLTSAEGGVLCTDDAELAERVRRLRFHGLQSDTFDRETQGRAPQAEVVEPGFKYNLPDMNAALGLSQLQHLESMNAKRAALAALYDEWLADVDGVVPLARPQYAIEHAWHLYVVRIDERKTGIGRDEFMRRLKELGIGSGIHFRAVHEHKFYRESSTRHAPLPNTEWNSARLCSLPLFPDMDSSDVQRVVDAIRQILGGVKR
jgi:UDP-4-amino-4-deoxy-L-arabinose-oxoglutarate aminotransferase